MRDRGRSDGLTLMLDDFTRMVGRELDAPVACLSLVDAMRRLRTSAVGMPRPIGLIVSWAFARRIPTSGPLLITDARRDARMAGCPPVRDGVVGAYLGLRLTTSEGHVMGTLSVMDWRPRPWTPPQLAFVRWNCDRIVGEVEAGRPRSRRGWEEPTAAP